MKRLILSASLILISMSACVSGNSAPVVPVENKVIQLGDRYQAEVLISNLNRPWGMAWMSDQKVLITERGGAVKLADLSNNKITEMANVIPVFASGQGGLLDVAVHPDFEENSWVYFTYSQGSSQKNNTAVARAKFQNDSFSNWETIFEVNHKKSGGQHFGSRLLWLPDQTLLVSIGDGGNPPLTFEGQLIRKQAQNLKSHLGKVIRINDDGTTPPDNPFTNQPNSLPEVWSYGHRNIQGLALDSKTNQIWASEHGARGGDELNFLTIGKNFGWPKASFSLEYTENKPVAPVTNLPGTISPSWVWTPAIAPSGLAIYRGDRHPDWDGHIFIGALRTQSVIQMKIGSEGEVQPIADINVNQRVRDVRVGTDGHVYILTDSQDGKFLRLLSN